MYSDHCPGRQGRLWSRDVAPSRRPERRTWDGARPLGHEIADEVIDDIRKLVTAAISRRLDEWDGHPAAVSVTTWDALGRLLADELPAVVARSRTQGAVWGEIGEALGLSEAGARQRFIRA